MPPASQTTHVRLPINAELSLTEFLPSDESVVVEHLLAREISDRTTNIAFPYGPKEFDVTMRTVAERAWGHGGCPLHFAIRDTNDLLIGCVAFSNLVEGHSAEVAYWLGKPFWGHGIMTAAVSVACQFAIKRWNLVRISAPVFDGNVADAEKVSLFFPSNREIRHPRKRSRRLKSKKKLAEPWFVYVVRCSDGSLYTGIAKDVERRIEQHNAGTASRYTRSRLPVTLKYQEEQPSQSSALKRELAIKAMSRKAKDALIESAK